MDHSLSISEAGKILQQLPTHLLRAAYLIGKIPFQALVSDPRVSYTLYIPPQYSKIHEALRNPDKQGIPDRLALLVNIHGTRRDAVTCRDSLIDFADKYGVAVLAPLFPAGLDSPLDIDNYKTLRSKTLQADLRLLDLLNEISHLWPGISTDPIILMGFSGGAQFVHRFLYLYPERVGTAVIAAPGKTTGLSEKEKWPVGIGNVGDVFPEQEIDVERIRQIPATLMIVGEDDEIDPETMELKAFIAGQGAKDTGNEMKSRIGASRVEGLKSLHEDWAQNEVHAEFKTVPGVGHNYLALLPSITAWLDECAAIVNG